MLDQYNNYVRLFRTARDIFHEADGMDFIVKLYSRINDG